MNLGDEQITGMSAKEMIKHVRDQGDKVIAMLPLYLYQHSGITMRTTPFGDPWDSGQVGWAVITKSRAEELGCVGAYRGPEGGDWDKARYETDMRAEVETYDAYLRGDCYGYTIHGRDGKVLDSCWGFIGELDYCREQAKESAECNEDPAVALDAEELAGRATFAGPAATKTETTPP